MIFDDLIVLFLAPILVAVEAVLVPIVNVFLLVVELILRLFISGFQIKRLKKRNWKERKERLRVNDYVSLVFIIVAVSGFLISGFILNREIAFIASDGHSLPFAEVVVTRNQQQINERTDMEGKLSISRFGTEQITMIDPRYSSKTWRGYEITERLVVERSKVGNAIELLTKKILKTVK